MMFSCVGLLCRNVLSEQHDGQKWQIWSIEPDETLLVQSSTNYFKKVPQAEATTVAKADTPTQDITKVIFDKENKCILVEVIGASGKRKMTTAATMERKHLQQFMSDFKQ
jgi:hypothetical protein